MAADRVDDAMRNLDERQSILLMITSGFVAALLVFPLTWLVIEALNVERTRAISLLYRYETLEILFNSIVLMVAVTALSILIGVPLAFLTVRTDIPYRRFWSVIVAIPLVVPSYIGAFAFVSAFGPRGELHSLLAPIGIDRLPEIYGFPGSVIVITLYSYPYVYLTTRGALIKFDVRIEDAARTLNRTYPYAFKDVTFPHLRPAVAAGALLSALYAVSDFGTPAIMRLHVYTRQIFVEYNAFGQDYAALLSINLLGIVLVIIFLEWLIRQDANIESMSGGSGGVSLVELGRWRWPVLVFPAVIAFLALLLPLLILASWLFIAEPGARSSLGFELSYVVNSVSISSAAAFVSVLMSLPVAYYAARGDSFIATVFERVTYVGFAVPGIVIGLALVYFGSSYFSFLYPSLAILVFAYVIRFIPQSVGSIRTTLLQVDPRLVEASRTLGFTGLQSFRHVTLPIIFPGVIAGASLVFLTAMKELPATLILRPTGFDTLVTAIWRAQEAAYFQYAAVPAFILLLVSAFSMMVLLSQETRV